MRRLAFFLVFCLPGSAWAFVLQVGSTYVNTQNGTSVSTIEAGTGVLADFSQERVNIVNGNPTQMLMTNSHLVEGAEPFVMVNGQRRRVLTVLSRAGNDAALLEIENTGQPAAYVFNQSMPNGRKFTATAALQSTISCAGTSCQSNRNDF